MDALARGASLGAMALSWYLWHQQSWPVGPHAALPGQLNTGASPLLLNDGISAAHMRAVAKKLQARTLVAMKATATAKQAAITEMQDLQAAKQASPEEAAILSAKAAVAAAKATEATGIKALADASDTSGIAAAGKLDAKAVAAAKAFSTSLAGEYQQALLETKRCTSVVQRVAVGCPSSQRVPNLWRTAPRGWTGPDGMVTANFLKDSCPKGYSPAKDVPGLCVAPRTDGSKTTTGSYIANGPCFRGQRACSTVAGPLWAIAPQCMTKSAEVDPPFDCRGALVPPQATAATTTT